MRIPLIETKDRMQLTNMAIELSVTNAFSRGGIPLKVHAVANVKLPSEESLLHNAIERFWGRRAKASCGRQRHAGRQPARCHRRACPRKSTSRR